MLTEIFKIIISILRLDKIFFKDKKNFGQASIYFAILLILIGAIISIIPNSSFLTYMGSYFELGIIKGPSLRAIIITSLVMSDIKSISLGVMNNLAIFYPITIALPFGTGMPFKILVRFSLAAASSSSILL